MPNQSSMNVGAVPESNIPRRTIFTGDEVLDPRKPINWQDIKGDNLKVMRGINSDCIDLIYLDPSFNSNRAYEAPVRSKAAGAMFRDAWTLDDLDVEWLGGIGEENPRVYSVITASRLTNGKGMQSYLCMMAVRLMEMHRILKATGSIYLHCDPTASHYLKLIKDAIFGEENFRNEIVWKRTGSHGGAKRWVPIHDTILVYSMSNQYKWSRTYQEYSTEYIDEYYRYEDDRGRYRLVLLTGAGTRQGLSGKAWRGIDPTTIGRHWAVPIKSLQAAYPHRADLNTLTT